MKLSNFAVVFLAALVFGAAGQSVQADTVFFDFQGNAGSGLLPGNENPAVVSGAVGGEFGNGLVYDDATNVLSLTFNFSGLTGGGLFNAADGGIHIHQATTAPFFSNNGGIIFNLNPGAANVALGSTMGTIDLDVTLSAAQETTLLSGAYYVNIHSGAFNGGELRGNLVVGTPEPTAAFALGLGMIGIAVKRRRI